MFNWFRRRRGISISPPAVFVDEAARDAHRKRLGQVGEEAAARQLRREGYRILQHNFFARGGEVDIIAEHAGVLVFVEVKTRSPRAWHTPESAVDAAKQARVARAAAQYLAGYSRPSPVRFDIVSVLTDDADRVQSVEIKRAAFDPQ